jgi:LmbE family N-acetylglucosaminyl deacetylase
VLGLDLHTPSNGHLTLLCLGCHSDDIEIGCGGAVLTLCRRHPNLVIHWIVLSANGDRRSEARRGADLFAGAAHSRNVVLRNFRDGFFPFIGAEIKESFEELKRHVAPDLIFTHYGKDAHQDHRLVSELTWNTFRDHMILEYEIPKYDGDLGRPNLFIPLDRDVCDTKVTNILEVFQSQHARHWFQRETFLGLMRLRGMECNAPSGYAEAFYSRKLML